MSNVVVFSPSRFSLYTICVTELLIRQNVNISAIVVRRLINRKRFFKEFKRDGSRLIKKILKKIVLRERAYKNKKYKTILELKKQENILFKKVDDFKVKYGIPVIYCNSLNDSNVVERLRKAKPDLVVFTGGGLIRKHILENSGAGVLNCHSGVLPKYRGMDVIEWAILEDKIQKIGMTVHFMDKGVDTGDILRIKKVKIEANENIKKIRDRFEPIICKEMVITCIDYLNGNLKSNPQKREDGKQYFIMHPRLIEIAERKLQRATIQK